MATCKYIETCTIYKKSLSGIIDLSYHVMYCKGRKLQHCERLKMRDNGRTVPENLLPNGTIMNF